MPERFGLSVALTTPFDEGGDVLLPAIGEHAKACLAEGCDSVTLFGTTGEGSSIGHRERPIILKATLDTGVSPRQIVAGVLQNSAQDAACQMSEAFDAGLRNVLLAPPSYFKNLSDDGLFDWFSSVFALLGSKARDVLVYNIPSITMAEISVDLVGRLRTAFPSVVVGVKDSGGDWTHTEKLLKKHGDLTILIGDERHLAQGTRLGGQGAISGLANIMPATIRAMALDGRDDDRVSGLVEKVIQYPVTPAVKVLLAAKRNDRRWLKARPPLRQLAPEECNEINAAFEKAFAAGKA